MCCCSSICKSLFGRPRVSDRATSRHTRGLTRGVRTTEAQPRARPPLNAYEKCCFARRVDQNTHRTRQDNVTRLLGAPLGAARAGPPAMCGAPPVSRAESPNASTPPRRPPAVAPPPALTSCTASSTCASHTRPIQVGERRAERARRCIGAGTQPMAGKGGFERRLRTLASLGRGSRQRSGTCPQRGRTNNVRGAGCDAGRRGQCVWEGPCAVGGDEGSSGGEGVRPDEEDDEARVSSSTGSEGPAKLTAGEDVREAGVSSSNGDRCGLLREQRFRWGRARGRILRRARTARSGGAPPPRRPPRSARRARHKKT